MIGYFRNLIPLATLVVAATSPAHAQTPEPWATYRGNPQRTASTDGLAGPAAPKVLWVHKEKVNYIASPVPLGDRLYVSGLGAFNLANFACLATEPNAKTRTLWSKTTPLLKLPTVSSPGVFKDYIIFGDGMHQTNGAMLYCLGADKGDPVWRHSVPGDLVHLEGSPSILGNKAYLGGGAAGVICIEIDKAAIDKKTYDLPSLQKKILPALWKELEAKYQIEKKKDPMFAQPPTEDQLFKAEPKRLWQQGKDKWHVDAPVAVIGDKVLVASAFLDKEQLGDLTLFCLDAKNGEILWKQPLKLNPWGGPSVSGDTVIVSGSSIGYDPEALKGAKGFIAAYNLKDGKAKWHKDITGGVVACAAIAGNVAIVTATDGKVRAFDLANGNREWIYNAKSPLFAPVAVAKDVVYAGDLKGVIHAIDLKSGSESWKLDLAADKQVQAPGMIYGGPVVQGGRLYVATCNLQGAAAGKETVVVCVGEK
jgi:outer membrane protein assembly factor BamB